MKKLLLMSVLFAAVANAADVEYVWVGGDSADWTKGENYKDATTGTTGTVPGSGDILTIPTNVTVRISSSDTASWAVFDALANVSPESTNSWLEITVPEGADVTNTSVRVHYKECVSQATAARSYGRGGLRKLGAGTLSFPGAGTIAYDCNVHVKEGTLRFGVKCPNDRYYMYVNNLRVDRDAVFYMPEPLNTTAVALYISNIEGEGAIRYAKSSPPSNFLFERGNSKYHPATKTFGGTIEGAIGVKNCVGTSIDLGTTHRTTASYWYAGSNKGKGPSGDTLFVEKFGTLANTEPSSLGKAGVYFRGYAEDQPPSYFEDSGCVAYTGTGETTDKPFKTGGNPKYPDIIDAGSHGGLHLTGQFLADSIRTVQSQTGYCLVLQGSGAGPSSFTGTIVDGKQDDGEKLVTSITNITKRGTTTWKFAPSNLSTWNGEFVVEEGAAQFVELPNHTLLKNGTVFEFAGTEMTESFGRVLKVDGHVTLRNATGQQLRIGAIEAASDDAELTVECAAGSSVVLRDVRDGDGSLSVIKTGAGSLELEGEQSFTGRFVAQSGTVKAVQPRYSYYRFTIRQSWSSYGGLREIGFWDADGDRQGSTFVSRQDKCVYPITSLKEGEMGITGGKVQPTNYYLAQGSRSKESPQKVTLEDWFSGTGQQLAICYYYGTPIIKPTETNENYWHSYTFHYPRDMKPMAYFDYYTAASNSYNGCTTSAKFEASVDGEAWDLVCDVPYDGNELTGEHWGVSKVKGYSADYDFRTKAAKVASGPAEETWPAMFDAVDSVELGSGATFETEVPITLDAVTVDASAASDASYKGVSFAAVGDLDIANMPTKRLTVLPVDVSEALDTENFANWRVSCGGAAKPGWKLGVKAGKLCVSYPGLMLNVR